MEPFNGYTIDLANNRAFAQLPPIASFYGADLVQYIDTYFVLNQPGTANCYVSVSELDVALINGGQPTAGTIVPGTGYSNGLHAATPLTGGSGEGATADITVSGNGVTAVLNDTGTISGAYQIGDVLSADFPLARRRTRHLRNSRRKRLYDRDLRQCRPDRRDGFRGDRHHHGVRRGCQRCHPRSRRVGLRRRR